MTAVCSLRLVDCLDRHLLVNSMSPVRSEAGPGDDRQKRLPRWAASLVISVYYGVYANYTHSTIAAMVIMAA